MQVHPGDEAVEMFPRDDESFHMSENACLPIISPSLSFSSCSLLGSTFLYRCIYNSLHGRFFPRKLSRRKVTKPDRAMA
jgi:hypothetical protein